jgi:hypothetical protein
MQSIDLLSLELLTNKTQYKKYLAKEDPKKFQEQKEFSNKIRKYSPKILSITKEFLENPDKLFTTEMNEILKQYAKTTIRYIELKEVERENLYRKDDFESDEEDDMDLFDPDKMGTDAEDENNNPPENTIIDVFSLETTLPKRQDIQTFWGNAILKSDDREDIGTP